MNREEQDDKIAIATGWKQTEKGWWVKDGQYEPFSPCFTTCLNAMHDAEKLLPDSAWDMYVDKLTPTATASDRAEIWLKVMGLWEEEE
jgi:hypothetical protein